MEFRVVETLGYVSVDWRGGFSGRQAVDSILEALKCSTKGIILDVSAADFDVPSFEIEAAGRCISRLLRNKVWDGAIVAPHQVTLDKVRTFWVSLGPAGRKLSFYAAAEDARLALEHRR